MLESCRDLSVAQFLLRGLARVGKMPRSDVPKAMLAGSARAADALCGVLCWPRPARSDSHRLDSHVEGVDRAFCGQPSMIHIYPLGRLLPQTTLLVCTLLLVAPVARSYASTVPCRCTGAHAARIFSNSPSRRMKRAGCSSSVPVRS